MTAAERLCEWCGDAMVVQRMDKRHCSKACNMKAYRASFKDGPLDDDESPVVWDGHTMMSYSTGKRYVATCMQCSARTDVSAKHAQIIMLGGARCARCRGNVVAERDDIGVISSTWNARTSGYSPFKAAGIGGAA